MDTKNVLEDVMGIPKSTLEDRRIVKHLCELVGTRAARLSAAGIVTLSQVRRHSLQRSTDSINARLLLTAASISTIRISETASAMLFASFLELRQKISHLSKPVMGQDRAQLLLHCCIHKFQIRRFFFI